MRKIILAPWTMLKPLALHGLAALEAILDRGGMRSLMLALLGVVVFWHLYTPVHELLHVAACWMTGGEVRELALKPQYGGVLLSRVFPFITPESEYGGQLTDFSVPNDAAYIVVDLLPYVLSLFGAALIEYCRRRRLAFLFGLGLILTFVPLASIPGDYYEAVSLLTTRLGAILRPDLGARALVSDDVFRSIGELREAGALDAAIAAVVGLTLAGAVYLALLTLALQTAVAEKCFGRPVVSLDGEAAASASAEREAAASKG